MYADAAASSSLQVLRVVNLRLRFRDCYFGIAFVVGIRLRLAEGEFVRRTKA